MGDPTLTPLLLFAVTDTVTSLQENAMPAIAPLEDLKSAQKEGLSIYAMLYLSSKAETTASEDALCSMLYGNGAG